MIRHLTTIQLKQFIDSMRLLVSPMASGHSHTVYSSYFLLLIIFHSSMLMLRAVISPFMHVDELRRMVAEYLPYGTDLSQVVPSMKDTAYQERAPTLTVR